MFHTKDDKYLKLMYIALGILIYLEFEGSIDVIMTMNVMTDILIWITIAVPTIYFVIKKDVKESCYGLSYSINICINGVNLYIWELDMNKFLCGSIIKKTVY